MKLVVGVAVGFLFGTALWALSGRGATEDPTPIGPKWWPSEWGPGDQRGAANRLTAGTSQVSAARLIQAGKVYSLGRVYEHGMPLPGKRHFSLTIPGSPTGGPTGKNQGVYHDDLFSGEIGQIGTQLDGLGHVGVRLDGDDYFYNGFRRSQFGTAYGLEKLGIENVGVFFTRGVLIDVAASRGVERMKSGEVITSRDLESALKTQGVAIREGDVVVIRTGHGQLWMKRQRHVLGRRARDRHGGGPLALRPQDRHGGHGYLGDRGRPVGGPGAPVSGASVAARAPRDL